MGKTTSIAWTHHTFNPWRGCVEVSDGCDNCYARTLSLRNPKVLGVWGANGERVCAVESTWNEPRGWARDAENIDERRRVFCASLADVFEEWPGVVASPWGPASLGDLRTRLWRLVEETPELDWLLLTKRPQNVARMVSRLWIETGLGLGPLWPSNCWLGTTTENEETFLLRAPILRAVPAVLRFLSMEPLLGRVRREVLDLSGIGWVIVGGESGPGSRPCRVEWVAEIVEACRAAGVPVFVKQLGKRSVRELEVTAIPEKGVATIPLHLKDTKGGDWAEWPEALRVREIPTAVPL